MSFWFLFDVIPEDDLLILFFLRQKRQMVEKEKSKRLKRRPLLAVPKVNVYLPSISTLLTWPYVAKVYMIK